MKIALVSPYDPAIPGGVTEHVTGLGIALEQLGHEVIVIAAGSGNRREPNVGTYRIGRSVAVPINGSRSHVTLDVTRFREVAALLRNERVDVVHVHQPFAFALSQIAILASRTATVGTFHALHPNNPWYRIAKPYLLRLLDRLDACIAVSAPVRDELTAHFGGEYCVIPNGIDLSRFGPHIMPFDWKQDDRPSILFVGRFTEARKGFPDLLQAIAIVRRQLPTARLVVVGPNPRARRSKREDLPGVDFFGQVSPELLPHFYASCSVFCAPSRERESFGIVLLEAMASGTALVATDIPGYASVISDGQNGLLVPPENPDALAEALRTLLTDRQLSARLGDNGRDAAARYAWPLIAKRIVTVYEEALRRKKVPT